MQNVKDTADPKYKNKKNNLNNILKHRCNRKQALQQKRSDDPHVSVDYTSHVGSNDNQLTDTLATEETKGAQKLQNCINSSCRKWKSPTHSWYKANNPGE